MGKRRGTTACESVSPSNCTVLGYEVTQDDDAWRGLDLDHPETEAFAYSILGADYHPRLPWWHPDGSPAPEAPEMYYRVRPKQPHGARFMKREGRWLLCYETNE